MTDRIYNTATVTICNVPIEEYAPSFFQLRLEKQEMLVNSEVHSTEHPVYVRHWTNAEDAQAWADVVNEFGLQNNFDMKSSIKSI